METPSTEVTPIFVETTSKNPHGELINILSILKVESTSKFSRGIDVIMSMWIRLSKLM